MHESRSEFFFLEVNPRLQVEHTVTEEIAAIDLVRTQLLISQGASIDSLNLPSRRPGASSKTPPRSFAIQLRVTAEDPSHGFTLSMGKITQVHSPGGRGVRVDTHLSGARSTMIGSSFDSLLAKVIVSAPSREEARLKGLRALSELVISGVKTNSAVLSGILASKDFKESKCSTRWLEASLPDIQKLGQELGGSTSAAKAGTFADVDDAATAAGAGIGGPTNLLFKKGDAFRVKLAELGNDGQKGLEKEHVIVFDRIANNDFPNLITGDVSLATEGSDQKKRYTASLAISTTGSGLSSSHHRKGDSSNSNHIILPFPGQVVEMEVQTGDEVHEGEVLMVVRQMKMELEIRAPTSGVLGWVCDVDEGENVGEGMLVCELQPTKGVSAGSSDLLAKL